MPTSVNGAALTSSFVPKAADILAGSVLDDSAIVTIPANRVWYGFINISGALDSAGASVITVNTTGTGQTPASAVELASLRLATTAADDVDSGAISTPSFHVFGGASGTTLDVSIDGAATCAVTAYGYLN